MPIQELCFQTANEISRRLRNKEVSAREIMEAHLKQIEQLSASVNTIVTLLPKKAIKMASEADEAMVHGRKIGFLHGLPVEHKDLTPTMGIRTTSGSTIFRDLIPEEDGLNVERLKKAGAITIGKTNTPEFGAACQTYNEVFGETLNPYDLSKTCGGSSGGAAVAWLVAWFLLQTEVIWGDHCVTQRISSMWWAFVHLQAECLCGLILLHGFLWQWRVPWHAQFRMYR